LSSHLVSVVSPIVIRLKKLLALSTIITILFRGKLRLIDDVFSCRKEENNEIFLDFGLFAFFASLRKRE